MEPNEIRAEVERRKQRAEDLKIRETLWSLHRHFSHCETWRREDIEWIYPGVRDTLEFADDQYQFCLEQTTFLFFHKEQSISEMATRGTFTLKVDDHEVFEFEWYERTKDGYTEPVFEFQLGEVTKFIEGSWVTQLTDLLQKIKAYSESVQNEREAPIKARELEALKKRFGI